MNKTVKSVEEEYDYIQLFESILIADRAFRRIERRGTGLSDRALARNPDYLQLHKAGMQIAILGGEAAIRGAISSLCSLQGKGRIPPKENWKDSGREWGSGDVDYNGPSADKCPTIPLPLPSDSIRSPP